MKTKLLAATSGTIFALAAGIALAGTPLENPPFTNGGFVPPNKDVLKAETATGNLMSKYTAAASKCTQNAVKALEKAYTAADSQKIADANTKLTACVLKANTKFSDGVTKQLAKGDNPACLQAAGINALKATLDGLLAANNPIVVCDAGQGVDPGSGLNVPANKNVAKGEIGVGAAAIKVGGAVAKCFGKSIDGDFKGAVDQAKHNDCVSKAQTKGLDTVQKLDAKGLLPSCLPLATAQTIINVGVAAGGNYVDETFCGSPSGAFLDGSASF